MFKSTLTLILVLLVMLSLTGILEAQEHKVVVMVSIDSLAAIIRDLSLDNVEIVTLIPEGAEPHSYQVSPETLEEARKADLFVFTGHLVFEKKLASLLPEIPVLQIDEENYFGKYKLETLELPDGRRNLHAYWLYPDNALAIAKAVVDKLIEIDPVNAEKYLKKLEEFKDKVRRIKQYITKIAEFYAVKNMSVIITFPGEQYVAYTMGFTIAGMLSKGEGVFASGAELSEIKSKLEKGYAKIIMASDVSRMLNVGKFIEDLSRETKTPIAYVRLIGSKDLTYSDLLMYNIGVIIGALSSTTMGKSAVQSRTILPTAIYALIASLVIVIAVESYLLYVRSKYR